MGGCSFCCLLFCGPGIFASVDGVRIGGLIPFVNVIFPIFYSSHKKCRNRGIVIYHPGALEAYAPSLSRRHDRFNVRSPNDFLISHGRSVQRFQIVKTWTRSSR